MLKKILLGAATLLALSVNAYAADLKEFRIGILGGENEADRLRNYQCLADHLKTTFGFDKVSLFPAADYDGVIQGLLGGTLDFAELGASGYAGVFLKDPKAVTPILTTQQADGSTGYYSIGLARKDSGIKTIMDAKGRWGSCRPPIKGGPASIRYSWRLALAPFAVADYVAAHECAHLVELNHGPRFWAQVKALVGDERPHRTWLRAEGARLHAFGG